MAGQAHESMKAKRPRREVTDIQKRLHRAEMEKCKQGSHWMAVYPGDPRFMYCTRLCGHAVKRV